MLNTVVTRPCRARLFAFPARGARRRARHAAQEADERLRLADIRLKEELEAISTHLDVQLAAERAENASLRSQLALRVAAAAAAATQLHEQHASLHQVEIRLRPSGSECSGREGARYSRLMQDP